MSQIMKQINDICMNLKKQQFLKRLGCYVAIVLHLKSNSRLNLKINFNSWREGKNVNGS